LIDFHSQYLCDKKSLEYAKDYDNSLLSKNIVSDDFSIFDYKIDGSNNTSIDIKQKIKDQVIDNNVSSLVFFCYEIQRQIVLFSISNSKFNNSIKNAILENLKELKPFYKSIDSYEWYDHCVANRLIFLRDLLFALAEVDDLKNYKVVFNYFEKHLSFLKKFYNYDFLTNHGLIVDHSCIVSLRGIHLKKYQNDSLFFYNRSVKRIDHFISDDGIPLEASTSYWFLIYELYNCIINDSQRYFGIVPDEYVIEKIKKVELFFDFISLDPKILRIGQSSIDFIFPKKNYKPKKNNNYKNLAIINKYDSGLVYINGFNSLGEKYFQLLINLQQISPKVHGHQDLGIICLYYNDVIYFDSPGSHKFKDLYGHLFMNPKSHKNQSLSYYKNGSYLSKIKKLTIKLKRETELKIQYVIYNNKDSIKRCIRITKKGIKLTDKKIKGNSKIISQFLTSPSLVTTSSENKFQMNEIEIFSNGKLDEREGWISYHRGRIEKTKMIYYENEYKNTASLNFDLKEIYQFKIDKNNTIYNKRNHYTLPMYINRNVRRFLNAVVKLNKYFRTNNQFII
jgi:hypothetical protein